MHNAKIITKNKQIKTMKFKRYVVAGLLMMTLVLPVSVWSSEASVQAQTPPPAANDCVNKYDPKKNPSAPKDAPCLPKQQITSTCPKGQCLIDKYIQPMINALAAMVGVAVTISLIWAGIQYASSADNSQKVSAAKQRIVTSIFVLVGFFFFYAFLNWIIPGGITP